jgi:hypothetical protein
MKPVWLGTKLLLKKHGLILGKGNTYIVLLWLAALRR